MRDTDRLGLAVLAAMALALTALEPVTTDRRLFIDALVMIGVVGIGGIVIRRLLPSDRGTRFIHVLVTLVAFVALAVSEGVSANPFAVPELLADAAGWTMESSAPMGANVAVRMVVVAAVTLLALLADLLTISLGNPAWSLLPLGLPYLVVALSLPTLAEFWPVLGLAGGYVLVLLADATNRNRVLRSQAANGPRHSLLLGAAISLICALLVSALAGVFTPGLDPDRGPPFTGQGPVQMGDPSLDLRRNLQQPVDRRVISYTTSNNAGSYLRLTSLPGFDATGFHLNAIDLLTGALPMPEGAPWGLPRFTIDAAVDDFNAEWLPLPYAPAAFSADGDWRFDPVSLSVLAAGTQQKRATNGLRYSATVVDVTPTLDRLLPATAGRPSDAEVTAGLPADFPSRIVELARRVTADGSTDGQKAMLLQNWLRSSAFRYSTDPAPGSGYDALTQFLLVDHTGYCEQFAASMAVMARALGIPSRVAIGFLPGRAVGDHWEITIHDMHAWPELFFAGLGWVSFEPTPGVATAPAHTSSRDATPSASPSPSPTPTRSTDTRQPTAQASAPAEVDEPGGGPAADLSWLGWVGAGVGLLTVAALPALVRRGRRARRLGATAPGEAVVGAWDELRDSLWDAGYEWPLGSARQIGVAVGRTLPDDAAAAMSRVAVLVERSRYADSIGDTTGLAQDVRQVRDAVDARGRGWWRRVFPRSLWRRLWWIG
ncbi:transglutaminaseTgpA domain-containing protein [Micropruina sp.]|uniref:transglutaminase family protein n=1 Tax=Micropruina sp. TaxID=2737536 RepID=UPI0039E4A65C